MHNFAHFTPAYQFTYHWRGDSTHGLHIVPYFDSQNRQAKASIGEMIQSFTTLHPEPAFSRLALTTRELGAECDHKCAYEVLGMEISFEELLGAWDNYDS